MADKACTNCRKIVEKGNTCPICKSNELTTSWKGMIIIYDSENSKLAKEIEIGSPGKYAIRVKG